MDVLITVDALPSFGLCNLCLSEGTVKSMLSAPNTDDVNGSYVEMLIQCFAIDISTMHLGDAKRQICDACSDQLQGAAHFRRQVEISLQTLESAASQVVKEESWSIMCPELQEDVPIVKQEDWTNHDPDDQMDCDDFDETSLADLIKTERISSQYLRKSVGGVLKRKCDTSAYPDKFEMKNLIEHGLFPFKIIKNLYTCVICNEKFQKLDDASQHIMRHKRKELTSGFKRMLLPERRLFEIKNSKFRCRNCSYDISNYEELKRHMEICDITAFKEDRLPFKLEKDQKECPMCDKVFVNFVSLNTHMNVHYPNYMCEHCGKAFASKVRLRGHMRSHEVGEFPCKHCDLVFDRVTKRENHVSKEHKNGIRYACKRCKISLPSFYARQKHMAEVHNEELKRYKCKACTQSYITPGHLSSHVRRDHLNERNHKCDKCDLAFYTRNSLKMHMIKHDGERIHVCHICHKSYQRKKTLKEHMRIHNNDKRFVCTVCGRAFTQKCTLKGHLRVHERKTDEPRLDVKITRYF